MKATRIQAIKDLLNPVPNWTVFRRDNSTPAGYYSHKGKLLTREQCRQIPGRTLIFLNHRVVSSVYRPESKVDQNSIYDKKI